MSYEELGKKVGALVDKKQEAYGNSFGRAGNVLWELYPEGIKPNQYDDALAIVRIIDKLFRIANKKDAFGEDPYSDIVGYSLLGMNMNLKKKEEEPKTTEKWKVVELGQVPDTITTVASDAPNFNSDNLVM
jgi:hypothetical protein